MTDKSLKNKAISFKGKSYVQVADRVLFFNENYPNGCITTDIKEHANEIIVIQAKVYPDGIGDNKRFFTGYAQEKEGEGYINKTSAIENCETSAVGRALAMMGIGVIESIASIDEINKATNQATNQEIAIKYVCSRCFIKITKAEFDFSKKEYGFHLCKKCQTVAKNRPKKIETAPNICNVCKKELKPNGQGGFLNCDCLDNRK